MEVVLTFLYLLVSVGATLDPATPPETCTSGGVRLVGGASGGEGRVEVCVGEEWASICDDNWDLSDANVVCQELGLGEASSAPIAARYGEGTGQIAYTDVDCSGNESSIFNCSSSDLFNTTCSHSDDASVVCSVFRVHFEQTSYVVSEFTGAADFCIISEPASFDVNADFTTNVSIAAVNGTATSLTDFIFADDIVTISTSSYVCVQVTIIDDSIPEPGAAGKTFTLSLSSEDSSVEVATPNTTISIQDNDITQPTLNVTPPTVTVESGSRVIFMCEISFEGGVRGSYQIQWQKMSGSEITSSEDGRVVVSDTMVTESGAMSLLTINNLFVSEAGPYVCQSSVDTYVFGSLSLEDSFTITAIVSPPFVFIFAPMTASYGSNISIPCQVSPNIYIDFSVTPVVYWEIRNTPGGPAETVQAGEVAQTQLDYSTVLEYSQIRMTKIFTCFAYFEPTVPSLYQISRGMGNFTHHVVVEPPVLTLRVSPSTQAIAAVTPYNTFTITCVTSIPNDVVGIGFNLLWVDSSADEDLSPSETVSISASVMDDSVSLNFVSNLTVVHTRTVAETLRIQCRPIETVAGISYRDFAQAVVEVRATAPPEQSLFSAVLISPELVGISWSVPRITYTPEVYTVQYQQIFSDTLGPLLSVEEVPGTTNLSSTFQLYSTFIEGLDPMTMYSARVQSVNLNGAVVTPFAEFTTTSFDNVVLLDDHQPQNLLAIPLGAPVRLRFRFSSIQRTGRYELVSISHSPGQQPDVTFDAETRIATVSYDRASLSLTGDYIMCRKVLVPMKRQTVQIPPSDCSIRISLSVYKPSLTVSTNLLVVDISDTTLQSVQIDCTPSDSQAPIRWRTFLGAYDQISSPYTVSIAPPPSHTAMFPLVAYNGTPPARTEIFICDLIDGDNLNMAVDPQMITLRFIAKPVALLNHDRELGSPAVVNTFNTYSVTGLDVVSLRCFSASARNLVWESNEVPALPSGVITQEDSPFVSIGYLEGVGVENRDVVLTVSPVNNQTSGFFTCRSMSDSSYIASAFVTLEQPFWRFTSPTEFVLPIGATLSFRAIYADFSDGYQNFGRGFNVIVTFESLSSDIRKPTVLSDQMTERLATEFVYSLVLMSGESNNGQYNITARHDATGRVYTQTVQVFVTVPQFVETDSRVIAREGELVTLRCIPNDTNAPVQWAKFPISSSPINSRPDLFTLSPPSLNHTLTFNTTRVAMAIDNFGGLSDSVQLFSRYYQCALFGRIDSVVTEVVIQREAVRLQFTGSSEKVFSNSVINIYRRTSDYDYRDRRNVDDYNNGNDHLDVECLGAQGNHRPLWLTSNPLLRNDLGAVTTERETNNYQTVQSIYTARLQLLDTDQAIQGQYTCVSQLTGALQTFTLSSSNPYVESVTPSNITIIEGQPLTIRFRVAVNSDGHTWDVSRTSFLFTPTITRLGGDVGEVGVSIPFQIPDPDYPQDYVYTVPRVRREQGGVYSARVGQDDCEDVGCGSAEADVAVNVIPACLEEIEAGLLWPDTVQNSVALLPCTMAGSRFRRGTNITRSCGPNGVWGRVDYTTCTLDDTSSSSSLIVYFSLLDPDLPFAPNKEMVNFDRETLEGQMRDTLEENSVTYTTVSLSTLIPTGLGVSVLFEVILTPLTSQDSLTGFSEYISSGLGLMGFGRYQVDQNAAAGVLLVEPAESCQCGSVESAAGSGAFLSTLDLCVGLSLSPCSCSVGLFVVDCVCQPPYVGNGGRCTLDSDGDGYPDVALSSPSCSDTRSVSYCVQDNCPTVFNVDQDPFACQQPPVFDGCPFGVDPVWGIEWPNTQRDTTIVGLCPGNLDSVSGQSTRYCSSEGEWGDPDVLSCQEMEFVSISAQASIVFALTSDPVALVEQTVVVAEQLAVITEPAPTPLLPSSLNTTNQVLTSVLDVLENVGNNSRSGDANEFIIDVLNNVLDVNNTQGWMNLQENSVGSQVLLSNAERFSEVLALSHNNTDQPVRLSRPNIAISAKLYTPTEEISATDLRFPQPEDLVNSPSAISPAEIEIPLGLLQERLSQQQNGTSLPVSFMLIRNVEAFLPPSASGLSNSRGASVVIGSRVGQRDFVTQSQVLLESPISLNFTFNTVLDTLDHQCVYWNFSDPVGSGGWVNEGVTTVGNQTTGNLTRVQCSSTHLTSFAVLVDVAGGLRNISEGERIALQVVSYVGCAISLVCLLITIIFFIAHGKQLLISVHYFVHLNLSISLFLAYLVFVVGIETAVGSTGGCAFVAALLHYLFLSAFCWMLCEAVMLYLLLVVVFTTISKKWWFFLLLGYLTPLPFVVVTVAARWQYYGVRDESGTLQFCWLSTEQGTIAGFVAPMLVIIVINVVLLGFALRALCNNQKRQVRRKHKKSSDTEKNLKIAKAVLLASIVLLPLLGLTWVFGLLTVDSNTTVFAWIFTILNSLQGLAIFFFHVVRNEKVWGRIRPRIATTFRNLTLRSTYKSSTYEPNKSSTYGGNTSERYKSATDSEIGLGTFESSDGDTLKTDISKGSQESNQYAETKIDLAAESDRNKLLTVQEEESVRENESGVGHVTAEESRDSHVTEPMSKEGGDISGSAKVTETENEQGTEVSEIISNQGVLDGSTSLEGSASKDSQDEKTRTLNTDTLTSL